MGCSAYACLGLSLFCQDLRSPRIDRKLLLCTWVLVPVVASAIYCLCWRSALISSLTCCVAFLNSVGRVLCCYLCCAVLWSLPRYARCATIAHQPLQTPRSAFRLRHFLTPARSPAPRGLRSIFRFACERGKGSLTSPNAAAATPRWAQDAAPTPDNMSRATAANISRNKARRVEKERGTTLRTDVARKTPLEAFSKALDPLRNLAEATSKHDAAVGKKRSESRSESRSDESGSDENRPENRTEN